MATVVSITQPQAALFGTPTQFTVSVQNTAGSNITLSSLVLFATTPGGNPATACAISPLVVTPELGTGVAGGNQLTVLLLASTTMYFQFSACFFGQPIAGTPAQASNQFWLTANAVTTDGSVSSSPLQVSLSLPVFGVVGSGSPPNPALTVGALQFFSPFNAVFAL